MGGGFIRRCVVMLFVSPGFLYGIVSICVQFCVRRGLPFWGSLWRALQFMFWSPGFVSQFFAHWLQWFRPSYHPEDHDAVDRPGMLAFAKKLEAKKTVDAATGSDLFVFGPTLTSHGYGLISAPVGGDNRAMEGQTTGKEKAKL
jgi:hypothetical protein